MEVGSHELKKFGKIGRNISWQVHFLRQNISCCEPSRNALGVPSPGKQRSRQCEVLLFFSDFHTNRALAHGPLGINPLLIFAGQTTCEGSARLRAWW